MSFSSQNHDVGMFIFLTVKMSKQVISKMAIGDSLEHWHESFYGFKACKVAEKNVLYLFLGYHAGPHGSWEKIDHVQFHAGKGCWKIMVGAVLLSSSGGAEARRTAALALDPGFLEVVLDDKASHGMTHKYWFVVQGCYDRSEVIDIVVYAKSVACLRPSWNHVPSD